jgi:DNA polymerase-3 subunit delta'
MTETTDMGVGPPAPRANAELLGHEAAERTLLRAFGSGRLPHAWLITGPRGIGKATLAYRFARFALAGGGAPDLFDDAPQSLIVDPASETFEWVASGGHPDLRVVERGVNEKTGKPRTEIVVDDVRAANNFLHMTSAEGGWRVVVVDPADDLNPSASNALLKALEEPPPSALVLLTSHAPGGLLPTIRSRCCHLSLGPLSEDLVLALLARHAPELEAADRAALARLAEGSIGRALDLAAGGGLELYREMIGLLSDLPKIDVPRLHAFGDHLARERDGSTFRTGMELLVWWLARLVRGAAEGRLPPEVVPGEAPMMARLLEGRGLAQWLGLWEKIARLFAGAEGAHLERKQVVITALLEFEAVAT